MDNANIIKELKRKIGKDKVKDSDEFKVTYSYDATGHRSIPLVAVIPENEEDVRACLKIAYKYKVPVVPRGAGVGYTGGSIPLNESIALVFTKMNRILSINEKDMTAIVEPGVITYDLQQECEKRGLYYPPDPASLKTSTLGGNISENAGGPRCFKYGVTSNYVLKIEGFLINGDKVSFGSSSIKDVAGYDITSLICGSEGTLIVITSAVLRLIPKPKFNLLFRFDFNSLHSGAEFVEAVLSNNIFPSVLEFMDGSSIKAVYEYMDMKNEIEPGSIVLMELDGEREDIELKTERIKSLLSDFNPILMRIASEDKEKEKLWEIRRNISPAITKIKPMKINEDISVPRGRIPQTVKYINSLSESTGIKIVLFGHFGDGNIHTNIMIDPENRHELEKSEFILDKIFRYVIEEGGTISGEHGIGITKKRFLKYQYNELEIEIFRRIKKVFDPENLLNPGKIF